MGSRSSKRTDPHSSIVPAERGVIQKSGGEIVGLPAGYGEMLGEIKARIARSRIEAALAANHVLIDLYWHIGTVDSRAPEASRMGQIRGGAACERYSGDVSWNSGVLPTECLENASFLSSLYRRSYNSVTARDRIGRGNSATACGRIEWQESTTGYAANPLGP